MNKTKTILLLVIILGIGFFLRIYNLNKYDFWYDEAFPLVIVNSMTPQIFPHVIKFSPEPPLFYFVLGLWVRLTGYEQLFRLLPLLFGVLSVILIYFVGKRLFNKKVGLISAFLLAVSPFHVYYSQELRNYTFLGFLSLLSVYFLIRILAEEKLSLWCGFIFATIFCLYSHYYAVFLLLSENIYVVLYDKKKKILAKWFISQAIIFLFSVFHIYLAFNLLSSLKILNTFQWAPKPSIIDTFNTFNFGYYGTKGLYLAGAFIFLPAFLMGVCGSGQKKEDARSLLLFWLFVPISAALLVSIIVNRYVVYIHRLFLYSLPAYYILVANGLTRIKGRKLFPPILIFVTMLLSLALRNYYNNYVSEPKKFNYGVFAKREYRHAVEYIKSNFQDNDIIAHSSLATIYSFLYYYQDDKADQKWVFIYRNNYPMWQDLFNTVNSKSSYVSGVSFIKPLLSIDIRTALKEYKRIWFVYSGWNPNYKESKQVKQWLDKNLSLLKQARFKDIDIYLYEPKISLFAADKGS